MAPWFFELPCKAVTDAVTFLLWQFTKVFDWPARFQQLFSDLPVWTWWGVGCLRLVSPQRNSRAGRCSGCGFGCVKILTGSWWLLFRYRTSWVHGDFLALRFTSYTFVKPPNLAKVYRARKELTIVCKWAQYAFRVYIYLCWMNAIDFFFLRRNYFFFPVVTLLQDYYACTLYLFTYT